MPVVGCLRTAQYSLGVLCVRVVQTGSGSTILELSWETIEGYVQRVCVGWIGGLVKDNALRRYGLPSLHRRFVLYWTKCSSDTCMCAFALCVSHFVVM